MLLKYNKDTNSYNNFHCGDCFNIKINTKWKTVRIEKGSNWYLIDDYDFIYSCNKLEGCEIIE